MASDGHPGKIPAINLVHGTQAPTAVAVQPSGKILPQPGKPTAPPAAPPPSTVRAQVALLNKYLNDSGKPDQFRVAPDSDDKLIQQINPANGEVVGEFPASEFAALARSVGISGVLVDRHA
ncbi:MAG: flagellar protein FlaG [Pseudomonadota bacterium]|nr:flagellar protein FlaG [Pseudomonadota bacterium]